MQIGGPIDPTVGGIQGGFSSSPNYSPQEAFVNSLNLLTKDPPSGLDKKQYQEGILKGLQYVVNYFGQMHPNLIHLFDQLKKDIGNPAQFQNDINNISKEVSTGLRVEPAALKQMYQNILHDIDLTNKPDFAIGALSALNTAGQGWAITLSPNELRNFFDIWDAFSPYMNDVSAHGKPQPQLVDDLTKAIKNFTFNI